VRNKEKEVMGRRRDKEQRTSLYMHSKDDSREEGHTRQKASLSASEISRYNMWLHGGELASPLEGSALVASGFSTQAPLH
jgi:hypothetical protein